MTERMLATSTIDEPVETRQLFLDMEASLPIAIRFNEQGLKGLKAQGVDILALAIANSGTKRAGAKLKRNKRGFGI